MDRFQGGKVGTQTDCLIRAQPLGPIAKVERKLFRVVHTYTETHTDTHTQIKFLKKKCILCMEINLHIHVKSDAYFGSRATGYRTSSSSL